MMAGEIAPEEMKRVFNLGIGYCIVVSPQYEDHVRKIITGCGYNSWGQLEILCYNNYRNIKKCL